MITRMAKESVKGPGKTECDVSKQKGKQGRSCENLEEQTPLQTSVQQMSHVIWTRQ